MSQLLVTPAELRTAAGNLRETNNNFKTKVSELETSEGTLGTQWEGAAQKAFHNAFMNDKAYMDKFTAEIERYCQTLETIAMKYEAAEKSNEETAVTRKY